MTPSGIAIPRRLGALARFGAPGTVAAMGSDEALSRARLDQDPEAAQLVAFGLRRIGARDDEVLEVARATWRTETRGGACLVILTSAGLVVVLVPVPTGTQRADVAAPACVPLDFASIADVEALDRSEAGMVFRGSGDGPDFALRFTAAAERDRMLEATASALSAAR